MQTETPANSDNVASTPAATAGKRASKTSRRKTRAKARKATRPVETDGGTVRRGRTAAPLPYMTTPGTLLKILTKIRQAQTPDRFTQDYLSNTLGFRGGTAMQFIPLAKRIGLLATDGTPTDLYRSFRNPQESPLAMLRALRTGYAPLFERNEEAHRLDRANLEGLIVEATGLAQDSSVLPDVLGTFNTLKGLAATDLDDVPATGRQDAPPEDHAPGPRRQGALQLGYTIFLNLPNTSDITVFNAIFKSLRENLIE